MCELAHLTARTIVVGDLHRHVINLARCVADDELRVGLMNRIASTPYHPDVLARCQEYCRRREAGEEAHPNDCPQAWAADYFVTAWMARSGDAGTDREFESSYSVRWDRGGGDSLVRFRNAGRELLRWNGIMKGCQFVCLDAFEFLGSVKDTPETGLYLDPPFHGPGDKYRHKFGVDEHVRLESLLSSFARTRVVVRMYDTPLVRGLYSEGPWKYHVREGRKQSNGTGNELFVTRNVP